MENKPKVSVWCNTYNHEKYIKDALEGFLAQKTNFEFEIIVHDDASTDGTACILQNYEEKYPEKIRVVYEAENQYSNNLNLRKYFRDVRRSEIKGDYVALCEGDDFWIDPNKLQLQADYLDSHSECIMVCHDAVCIDYRDNRVYPIHPYFEERYLTEEEVIIQYRGDFPTASTTCRREVLNIDERFMQCPVGDYSYELYAITKGKIYFSTRIMSVYRFMHEGSWCRVHSDNVEQGLILRGRMIDYLWKYDAYMEKKYHHTIIYKELLFVLSGINLCRDFDIVEIENLIQQCNEKTNGQYEKYFARLVEIYKQINEEAYYPASMKAFAERYTHIYIYGAGKYGQRVARQLLDNDKDFEAFIVSEPSGQEKVGKPVIGIDKIPYSMENVGIIIAVNVYNWDEIRGQFENNRRFNYIYPYGITEII